MLRALSIALGLVLLSGCGKQIAKNADSTRNGLPLPTITPGPGGSNFLIPPTPTPTAIPIFNGTTPPSAFTSFLRAITLNTVPFNLAPVQGAGENYANAPSVSIGFTTPVASIIHIAGFARATYNNPSQVQFAAVSAGVFVDGNLCSSSLAVEGETGNVTFSAAASCVVPVTAGPHTLEVRNLLAANLPAMTNHFARVQYDFMAQPGNGVFTPIVGFERLYSDTPSVEQTFSINYPVIARIGGFVRATYSGSNGNAGVNGVIEIDGVRCGSSISFEGETTQLTFAVSPSCIEVIPAGIHTIRMRDLNYGGFTGMTASSPRSELQFSLTAAANSNGYTPMGYFGGATSPSEVVEIPYASSIRSVVHLSGEVSSYANPNNPVRGAAAQALVTVDGTECASYINLEGETYAGGFNANASCIVVLSPGSHLLKVRNPNFAIGVNMRDFNSRLKFVSHPLPE